MKPSLLQTNPELAVQWHPTLNGELLPDMVTFGSGKVAWWLGDCGHSWNMKICTRTGQNQGCPYCAGKKVLSGFNDLLTTHPNIAAQWHPTLNTKFSIESITAGSDHRVWWLGECGHEWDGAVRFRTKNEDSKCPLCLGRRIIRGINDFPTTHPELFKNWDIFKNAKLDPFAMGAGSKIKVWWKCENKHEWFSKIAEQSLKEGIYCAFCAGKRLFTGLNDLETLYPEIAKKWHSTKNTTLASEVSPESHDNAWWIGQCGHEWKASIRNRCKNNAGCPYCSNRILLSGFNDLRSARPEIASQWDYSKNDSSLNPDNTIISDPIRIWWVCEKEHSWVANLKNRCRNLYGCPECAAASRVSKGEQELADFLIGLGLNINQSDRKQIGGKELDIYIPDHKFAIEYNGVFWHSEDAGKDKFYHYDKWLACNERNIQLLQVWEDDWVAKPEIVKSMILSKLGLVDKGNKVFARKTKVTRLSITVAQEFLDAYHIQGFSSGSVHYGLVDKDDTVVAVMTLKKRKNDVYEISRFATAVPVPGGFTKVLCHAEKELNVMTFVTFSDNCVSDGGLYKNNGFIADKDLAPDYSYLINGQRKHKFGYRSQKFKSDPTLLWEASLTEKELAKLNGISRIWDAGKVRWIKRQLITDDTIV